MLDGLVPGDRLALLGGTYTLSGQLSLSKTGTAQSPILVESYPGELAVFQSDGSSWLGVNIAIWGSYYKLRGVQVRDTRGPYCLIVFGTGNVVEGNEVKDSPCAGIALIAATNPVVRDNVVHDLSNDGWNGVNLPLIQYGEGGWSDGIGIDRGTTGALIEYNTIYRISDDGIDTWNGRNYVIQRNVVHSNGISNGLGMGIRYSGPTSSGGTVRYNFSWGNKGAGFHNMTGPVDVVEYNTAWNNREQGIYHADSQGGSIRYNISVGNLQPDWVLSPGTATDNSWQRGGTLMFQSTTYPGSTFLKPMQGAGFDDIGAWRN